VHLRIFQTFAGPSLRRLARGRLRDLDREQQIGPGSAVANVLAFLQYARSSAANGSPPSSCSFSFFEVGICSCSLYQPCTIFERRQQAFIWLLTTVLLTTAPLAEAQQPAKVPRIESPSLRPSRVYLTLIRHYFEAAWATSPTAVGDWTLP
jgi:hypothetical protein